MAEATRDIKRRIRSITNTKKITKALELVSAAKMRKAIKAVLATRAYANSAWEIVNRLAARTETSHHPLLEKRSGGKKIGLILVTSNRGLCGGFNHEIINQAVAYLKKSKEEKGLETEVVLIGKRGREIVVKYGATLAAEFNKTDVVTEMAEISPIAKLVLSDYLAGKYDQIVLAYSDFISPLKQGPRLRQLLPFGIRDEHLGFVKEENKGEGGLAADQNKEVEYLFEPCSAEVLEFMLPRLVEMQIYQALLESNASEHSARMMMMRQATDASEDMISDLTLTYNQARQAGITREIAEISAGRTALE